MKSFLSSISDLFASWASSAEYGSVAEIGIEPADSPKRNVYYLPSSQRPPVIQTAETGSDGQAQKSKSRWFDQKLG